MGVVIHGGFKVVHIKRYFTLNVFVLMRFHCREKFVLYREVFSIIIIPSAHCSLSVDLLQLQNIVQPTHGIIII